MPVTSAMLADVVQPATTVALKTRVVLLARAAAPVEGAARRGTSYSKYATYPVNGFLILLDPGTTVL